MERLPAPDLMRLPLPPLLELASGAEMVRSGLAVPVIPTLKFTPPEVPSMMPLAAVLEALVLIVEGTAPVVVTEPRKTAAWYAALYPLPVVNAPPLRVMLPKM